MSDNFNTTDISNITQKKEKSVHIKYSRIKRRFLRHIWLARAILVLFIVAALLLPFGLLFSLYKDLGVSNLLSVSSSFLFPNNDALQSENGSVNILVLGIGGKGHEGALLTDTIFLVSVPLQETGVKIFSIPRDIWIPEIRAKINSAYYWGNQKSVNGGPFLSKSSAEEVLGIKPHYFVVIDFSGFKNIIDELGGIEVEVERTFTDTKYPISGKENDLCLGDKTFACRYETITFDKGFRTMDGETALKFVRSRHSEGDEGTDTARQMRQQKVLSAVKNKITSKDILLNPKKTISVFEAVKNSIETDLNTDLMAMLARKLFDNRDSVVTNSIPENLLTNPSISNTYDKQYVFIPTAGNGNWKEIHDWVKKVKSI